jgi:hypothetical protein
MSKNHTSASEDWLECMHAPQLKPNMRTGDCAPISRRLLRISNATQIDDAAMDPRSSATAYCLERGKQIKTVLTSENGSGFLEIEAPAAVV